MLWKRDFTLDDFRKQLAQIRQLAKMKQLSMRELLGQMPGTDEMIPEGVDPEAALNRIEDMIHAMTPEERLNPEIMNESRRSRIARDSGVEVHALEQFLDQFAQVRMVMRHIANMTFWQRLKLFLGFGRRGMLPPGAGSDV